MSAGIIFIILLILVAISVPIGISIGLSTLITMLLTSNIPTILIAQKAFNGLDSFALLAIPLFILAGNLMARGGISKRLLLVADDLVGFITGGLAMVSTLACMFFAAISGSAPATTSAIGSFMIPDMKKKNYNPAFASAIVAAAGSIGIIIPPSIPFVIYGVATGTSITDLFKAGILPGIAVGIGLMVTSFMIAKKNGWKGSEQRAPIRKTVSDFKMAILALLLPVIMLGSIYSGWVTPTESAVIGVIYAFIVGRFVYKELTMKEFYHACVDTVLISGATTFMIGLSSSFANFLTMEGMANKASHLIFSVSSSPVGILLAITVFLLLVGCFIDNISATIILSPILLPVVESLGMSAVQFGVIITMNLAIGFVTPPFGSNLFVASSIGNVAVEKISKQAIPLIISMIIVLLVTTFFEPLTMIFVGGR